MKRRLFMILILMAGAGGCTAPTKEAVPSNPPETPPERPATTATDAVLRDWPEFPALSDYLARAALNNPGLKAAFGRWRAAEAAVPQAEALPNPRFTYGHYIEEVETRVGPQENRLGLSQTFPWYGKRSLGGEVATSEAQVAFARYQAEKLRLFFEVKDLYYELYYLGRAIAILRDNMRLLTDLESVAQINLRGGADLVSVSRLQTELGHLDNQQRSLEQLREPLNARLNALLNRRSDAPIPWPTASPAGGSILDEEALLETLAEQNPTLREGVYQWGREDHAVALARKVWYPDITLGIDYIHTGNRSVKVDDNGKDPIMASISFDLPLWPEKNRSQIYQARERREAAWQNLENERNRLTARLQQVLYEFRDAQRKINLYRDTLTPLAEQSLAVSRQAWETGRAAFIELVDAERMLLEFQLQYERAVADRAQRLAEIEMLVGKELGSEQEYGVESGGEMKQP